MDKKIGYVITAGHLDIEWYQPLRSFRFWTMDIMEDLKKISKERPDFKSYLLDGQVFPLEEHLKVVPEDEAALRELIKSGLLVIGPFYTQFDEWLPSAESIIRNCLVGRKKSEKFGSVMKAGYLPDNFGHPLQLPQILNGFGIDSLMFMRGMPEIEGGHPDEFIYRGIDGSEVLASHFREGYGGAFNLFEKKVDPIQPRTVPYYEDYLSYEWHRELAWHENPSAIAANLIENVHNILHRYPSGIVPLISGFDHLPPQYNIGECVKLANEMQDEIDFVMGNPEEYASAVRKRLNDPAVYSMELIGSKYQYVLLGALSTRTYLKRQNFAAETLMERYAEPLAVIASLYGYTANRLLFDEAWTNLLVNSAHDSIHGSSVDEVHVEMEARFAAVRQIAAGLIHSSMKHIANQLTPWWTQANKAFISYCPAGAAHVQPCEFWVPIGSEQKSVVIMDRDGRRLPTQLLEREPVAVNSKGLPRNDLFPMATFRKVLFLDQFEQGNIHSYECKPSDETAQCQYPASDTAIENEFLRVETQGALISILDKRSGRWSYNLNLLEEDADAGDAWDYSPTWAKSELVRSTQFSFSSELVENGAVRSVINMKGTMSVPGHLEGDARSAHRTDIEVDYEIILYAGTPRADIKLKLNNTAKDHRVRLCVPMGLKTAVIKSQGHLAILERPIARQKEIEPWQQPPTQLLPFREWIAADDGKLGLAIAFKGVYDYEAVTNPLNNEPEVGFTLFRSIGIMARANTAQRDGQASWAHLTPGAQCLGEQVIEWSYIPYQADATDKAPFLTTAQSFLYPVTAHVIRSERSAEGLLETIPVPVWWEEGNICYSAFKRSYDRQGYILRLYENQGKAVTAILEINGFSKAFLVNMNEEIESELTVDKNRLNVDFAAYKCVTLFLVI